VDLKDEYLARFFEELAREISPNGTIKRFADNSDVVGAFAEAAVARLVRRMVEPLRVSTGAVISPELIRDPSKVPQVDLIIWAPNPLPAIFEAGDFALVPRRTVFGVIEVKRSNYSDASLRLKAFVDRDDLTIRVTPQIQVTPASGAARLQRNVLGVVCLREATAKDAVLDDLIQRGAAVCLIEKTESGYHPSTDGMKGLVNFLADVRFSARELKDGVWLA